jgi:SAM-dependent methyltransferase
MKTLAEIFRRYGGPDCHSGSDKATVHSFVDAYEILLAPYRLPGARVLEIGILTGSSLRALEEYFSDGSVYGVDLNDHPLGLVNLRPVIDEGTHRILLFNAVDPAQVEQHLSGLLFNVIIEDASHAVADQLAIYQNFRHRLAPGGIYIIEDIENIDRDRELFKALDPQRTVRIVDLRYAKNRFDDVLVVIK